MCLILLKKVNRINDNFVSLIIRHLLTLLLFLSHLDDDVSEYCTKNPEGMYFSNRDPKFGQ